MNRRIIEDARPFLIGLIREAQDALDSENDYWERLATGQTTEEAEHSGFLSGQIAGLSAALAILNARPVADVRAHLHLDLRPTGTDLPEGLHIVPNDRLGTDEIRDAQGHTWVTLHPPSREDPDEWASTIHGRILVGLGLSLPPKPE